MSRPTKRHQGASQAADASKGGLGKRRSYTKAKAIAMKKAAPTEGKASKKEVDQRVFSRATQVLGNPTKAQVWLQTPNPALGGAKPADRLESKHGLDEVETKLGRIEFGVYS